MRKYLLIGLALIPSLGSGVSFVRTTRSATGSAVSTVSVGMTTTTAHDFIGIGVIIRDASSPQTVTSVTDDHGSVFTKIGDSGAISTSASRRAELWGTIDAVASSTITVNLSGASTEWAFFVGEYSGVFSVGQTTSSIGSSTKPSCNLTNNSGGVNDFLICQGVENNNSTITASKGTIRTSRTTSSFGGAFVDTTTIAPSLLSAEYNIGTTTNWSTIGVDLVSGANNRGVLINGGKLSIVGGKLTIL